MSGTIGAVGNNGVGVVGVNWNVKIMALKFLDAGGYGDTADAIEAVLYAADHGAQIASNSWGGDGYSQALLDAIQYGASKGMLFTAAAGNGTSDNDASPFWPADYSQFSDAVVAVAATDAQGRARKLLELGQDDRRPRRAGSGILSTVPGGGYDSYSGTSMATPHVSGVAALIKARFPAASAVHDQGAALRKRRPRRVAEREDDHQRQAQRRERRLVHGDARSCCSARRPPGSARAWASRSR